MQESTFTFIDGPGCHLEKPNDLSSLQCDSSRTFNLTEYHEVHSGASFGYELDFLRAYFSASGTRDNVRLELILEDKHDHLSTFFVPMKNCAIAQ